jgi:hypothetical protein
MMTSPFETTRELRDITSELLKHCTTAIETDLKLRKTGLQYPVTKSALNVSLHCNVKKTSERIKLSTAFCESVGRSYRLLQDIQEMLHRLYGRKIIFNSMLDYRYTCRICNDFHYELRFFTQFLNFLDRLVFNP